MAGASALTLIILSIHDVIVWCHRVCLQCDVNQWCQMHAKHGKDPHQLNAPIIFNSSSSGTSLSTAHAAPAQTTSHSVPAKGALRRHQQHRVFPRRFHLLLHLGIVLWNWLSIFGSTGTLSSTLSRPVAPDSPRWSADFPAHIQRIHRQLLLANERMGNASPSARRTSAASRI